MLSVSRIGSPGGAAAYYSKEDHAPAIVMDISETGNAIDLGSGEELVTYYTASEDELGATLIWQGKGAEALGLEGAADEADFKALLYGLNPDPEGDALSRREQDMRKTVTERDAAAEADKEADLLDREDGGQRSVGWNELSIDERIALLDDRNDRHAAGWDLTFSAPKAVSIIALDAEGDGRLVDAHGAAVDVALAYIEAHFSVYRVRNADGSRSETISGNLVMARTTHALSRAGDPNLHDHVVVLNATQAEDGTWRALESEHIYRHMKLAGAIYQAELRNHVLDLGYDVNDGETLNTFTLAAVPAKALDAHSRRHAQIEGNRAEMEAEKGRPLNDNEREAAVLKDRPGKSTENMAQLKESWAETNMELGLSVPSIVEKARGSPPGRDRSIAQPSAFLDWVETVRDLIRGEGAVFERPEAALAFGRDTVFDSTTVATQHDILMRAMIANGNRLRLSAYLETGFFDSPEFLKADKRVLAGLTTQETLDREGRINAHIEAQRGKSRSFDPTDVTGALLATQRSGFRLTEDQFRAVKTVLESTDGVVALQGSAGTGKTTAFDTLQALHASLSVMTSSAEDTRGSRARLHFAVQSDDRARDVAALLGAAPTHAAVKELTNNHIQAQTLSSMLGKFEYAKSRPAAEMRKLKAEFSGSWVLFDETSMIGNRQLETVFEMQTTLGIDKIILSGDVRQIAAMQAGAPFKMVMEHNPAMAKAELTTIMRQSANPTLKEVVVAFAAGRSGEAMKRMLPFIHELGLRSSDEALADKAHALWTAHDGASKIVVDTNKMRSLVNERIRTSLTETGELTGPGYYQPTFRDAGVSGADKLSTRFYAAEQVLYFFAGVGGIKAGATLVVESLNHKRNIVKARDGDRMQTIDLGQRSKGRDLPFGIYQRSETPFSVGERVLFNKTDREREIRTNEEFRIADISDEAITFKGGDEGRPEFSISRSDPQLKFMTYAYAVTADKAQGQSFAKVIGVLRSTGQGEFVNAARAYIMASRAKANFDLVTDSFAGLMRKVTENDGINLVGMDNLFGFRTKNHHQAEREAHQLGPECKGGAPSPANLTADQAPAFESQGSHDLGEKSKSNERAQPERSM